MYACVTQCCRFFHGSLLSDEDEMGEGNGQRGDEGGSSGDDADRNWRPQANQSVFREVNKHGKLSEREERMMQRVMMESKNDPK